MKFRNNGYLKSEAERDRRRGKMTQLKEGYCQVFESGNGFERASYIIKNVNGNSISDNGRIDFSLHK